MYSRKNLHFFWPGREMNPGSSYYVDFYELNWQSGAASFVVSLVIE